MSHSWPRTAAAIAPGPQIVEPSRSRHRLRCACSPGSMRMDHLGPAQVVEGPVDRRACRPRSRSPCPRRADEGRSRLRCPASLPAARARRWPIQRPLAFSITENIAKPCMRQRPACPGSAPGLRARLTSADEAARLLGVAAARHSASKSPRLRHAQDQAFGFQRVGRIRCADIRVIPCRRKDGANQNALMPVTSRPITSWCTVSVPS